MTKYGDTKCRGCEYNCVCYADMQSIIDYGYGKFICRKDIKRDKEIERLSIELNQCMIERNNYLSRNEKAIEYIEQHTNRLVEYLDVFEAQDLVNILQGVDKE